MQTLATMSKHVAPCGRHNETELMLLKTASHNIMTDRFLKSFSTPGGGLLAKLEKRAKRIQSLTDKVRAALPEPQKPHVLAAAYHEDTLVITTDSAAWTAQIRFAQDELRKSLHEQGEKLFVQLKVKVGQAG